MENRDSHESRRKVYGRNDIRKKHKKAKERERTGIGKKANATLWNLTGQPHLAKNSSVSSCTFLLPLRRDEQSICIQHGRPFRHMSVFQSCAPMSFPNRGQAQEYWPTSWPPTPDPYSRTPCELYRSACKPAAIDAMMSAIALARTLPQNSRACWACSPCGHTLSYES